MNDIQGIIYVPGSAESLGDLSRKLAAAAGRPWPSLTMGECDAWHEYSSALIAALYAADRENPNRKGLN